VQKLEILWRQLRQSIWAVPFVVMHCIVLLGPQELERRHGDYENAAWGKVLRRPPHGATIVLDMLEHVEHREQIEGPRKGLGNRVLHHAELTPVLLAKELDRARVPFGAQHIAETRKHREVAAARTSDLGDPQAFTWRRRQESRDHLRKDLATRAPPPMTVFDRRMNVVFGSVHGPLAVAGRQRGRVGRAENKPWQHIHSLAHDLKIKTLMSVGHPGESEESVRAGHDWLLKVQPDDFDCTVITTYPRKSPSLTTL